MSGVDSQRVRPLLRAVLATLLITAMGGCGSGSSGSGGSAQSPTSPTQTPSATSTASPKGDNPCWGKGADNDPPNSSPSADMYVGLSERAATMLAQERHQELRVAGRDGRCYPLTADYNPNRVNLYIESHQVVAAVLG